MEAHIQHTVRIFITGNELRKIADKVDNIINGATVGDSLIAEELDVDGVCIKIIADQTSVTERINDGNN